MTTAQQGRAEARRRWLPHPARLRLVVPSMPGQASARCRRSPPSAPPWRRCGSARTVPASTSNAFGPSCVSSRTARSGRALVRAIPTPSGRLQRPLSLLLLLAASLHQCITIQVCRLRPLVLRHDQCYHVVLLHECAADVTHSLTSLCLFHNDHPCNHLPL